LSMNRSARAAFSNADSSGISHVDSLFRRFAVEVFVVGLGFSAGVVDNIVSMIRRRIERIELQGNHYREAGADRRPNAIENRFTGVLLQ